MKTFEQFTDINLKRFERQIIKINFSDALIQTWPQFKNPLFICNIEDEVVDCVIIYDDSM